MHNQNRGSSQHFNAYYEDNSLLIQFIISTFIETHHLLSHADILKNISLDSLQASEIASSSLTQIFFQLIENQTRNENCSFPRRTRGCLTKLKDYCEQHSRNSRHNTKQHVVFHLTVHQMWLSVINALEIVKVLQIGELKSAETTSLLLHSLKETVLTIQARFNQVMLSIPSLIKDYWDNENVLQYILRVNAKLVEIYGDNFLYKKLKCPLDAAHYTQLLVLRYRSRGFDELPPQIAQVIALKETLNANC